MLHVSPESNFDLPKWLQQFGHIKIVETSEKEPLREGAVVVAPPGQSLRIQDGQLRLEALERTLAPRITINSLFESAAQAYGDPGHRRHIEWTPSGRIKRIACSPGKRRVDGHSESGRRRVSRYASERPGARS
jgi:hypothetical protein